jgi:hypothetical protein
MIIRIGDEKRQQKDDHIKKLSTFIISEETLKNHRELVIDILIRCIANMPHKCLLYAAITATIALDNEALAQEIVNKVSELLQEAISSNINIFTAKNIMRFLSALVEFKVIDSQLYSQMIINLLDEVEKSKTFIIDTVLEPILAGLPLAVILIFVL